MAKKKIEQVDKVRSNKVLNQDNVLNARFGVYGSGYYVFTHRNPFTGDLWGEDIATGDGVGAWVPGDKVKLL